MAVDLDKVIYYSGANSFKNTGVFSTSITTPSSLAAGATATTSSVVTLSENQSFAYAIALYTEYQKGGAAAYQVIPTFDARVECLTAPFVGPINYAVYFTINGSTVTFNGFMQNPYGVPITLTPVTITIRYVTYTVDT